MKLSFESIVIPSRKHIFLFFLFNSFFFLPPLMSFSFRGSGSNNKQFFGIHCSLFTRYFCFSYMEKYMLWSHKFLWLALSVVCFDCRPLWFSIWIISYFLFKKILLVIISYSILGAFIALCTELVPGSPAVIYIQQCFNAPSMFFFCVDQLLLRKDVPSF